MLEFYDKGLVTAFKRNIFNRVPIRVSEDMHTCVQVPAEFRDVGAPWC